MNVEKHFETTRENSTKRFIKPEINGTKIRLHHGETGNYSWWDYRMAAFRRDLGYRIDNIIDHI